MIIAAFIAIYDITIVSCSHQVVCYLSVGWSTSKVSASFTYTYIQKAEPYLLSFFPDEAPAETTDGKLIQVKIGDMPEGAVNVKLSGHTLSSSTSAVNITIASEHTEITFFTPSVSDGTVNVVVEEAAAPEFNVNFDLVFRPKAQAFIAELITKPSNVITELTKIEFHVSNLDSQSVDVSFAGCGATQTPTAFFTMLQDGGLYTQGFEVDVPAACALGDNAFSMTASGHSETRMIALTAPPVAVSPLDGTELGGTDVTLMVYGFTNALTAASDITVSFGGVDATVSSIVSSEPGKMSTVVVSTPSGANAGVVACTVTHASSSESKSFEFTYLTPPRVDESTKDQSGHTGKMANTVLTISTVGMPGTSPKFLEMFFGAIQARKIDMIYARENEMSFRVKVPPSNTPGKVLVTVMNKEVPQLGSASFNYEYYTPPPVMMMDDMSGSTVVDYTILLTLLNWAPVTKVGGVFDTASLNVVFGGTAGTVSSVVFSTDDVTVLAVQPPNVTAPAKVDFELSNSVYQSVTGVFTYIDTAVEITSAPGMDRMSGGSVMQVTIKNFAEVSSPTDVVCKFGFVQAAVNSIVSSNTNSTTLTVTVPAYPSTSVVDIAVATELSLYATSDEKTVYQGFIYKPLIRIMEAKFSTTYDKISFITNVPFNATMLSAKLADNCSQFLDTASITRLGANKCEMVSATEITAQTANLGVFSSGITPNSELKVLAGALWDQNGFFNVEGTVTVTNSDAASNPSVRISAPGAIDPCKTLVLDATSSKGVGKLNYAWSCTNDATLNSVIEALPPRGKITILASKFTKTAFQYEFKVSVSDFTGLSGSSTHSVVRSGMPVPGLQVQGAATRTVDPSENTKILVVGTFSACASSTAALIYEWKQTAPSDHTVAITASGGGLFIAGNTLRGIVGLGLQLRLG